MTLFEKWVGHTLIAADDTWGLLLVMCGAVALSIWLEQKYKWASKVSGAIIALIIAMIFANVGIIPISSVLYDDIVWGVVVPMGIPLLLLQCNLKKIWKDAGRMLVIFLIEVAITRIVSLGSIIIAALYPVGTLINLIACGANLPTIVFSTVCCAIMAAMVIWLHRSNIERLKNGTEYRFGEKK